MPKAQQKAAAPTSLATLDLSISVLSFSSVFSTTTNQEAIRAFHMCRKDILFRSQKPPSLFLLGSRKIQFYKMVDLQKINEERRKSNSRGKANDAEMMRRFFLGLGFWVQGMRFFPWLGVNFFLKDGLKLRPSTLQILQSSANLPMVAKPFYGILSDSYYIFGQHRVPYIGLGAALQAFSWLAIAFLSQSGISFFMVTFYLLLSNLGASIVEVANDAIVAETSKEPVSSKTSKMASSGNLQSFVWMASSIGGALGNLMGGVAIDRFSPRDIFLMYGAILAIQFLITICTRESSLRLPKSSSNADFKEQVSELLAALRKPEISCSIAWFAATYAVVPSLFGTMFFYQTEHLKMESSVLGISKVLGQVVMLLWGVIYDRYFKLVPARKVITSIQVTLAVFALSDLLFVKGIFRAMGFPDSLYVIAYSGVVEVLMFTKLLPFTVLLAQLCPPGCEGSVMAFLMSAVALSMVVGGYFGVALTAYLGITGNNFSGFPMALLLQAVCTVLPLYWAYCVPDAVKPKSNGKEQ